MPWQNRVTPFGTMIVTPARGTLMGNRGCLHNAGGQIQRLYQVKRWIFCRLNFKGRRRNIMTPGHYTELFFLDEVTALAAGHRPCVECNRLRFIEFRSFFLQAHPELAGKTLPADHLDNLLHDERITATREKVTYQEKLDRLPPGSFITLEPGETPYLVLAKGLAPWSPGGYGPQLARPAGQVVTVLTPRSTVAVLARGYQAAVHPSAFAEGNDENFSA